MRFLEIVKKDKAFCTKDGTEVILNLIFDKVSL